MIDRERTIKELGDLCEYMFHEYRVCYHGDESDTYNRFLTVHNAIVLLKEQKEQKQKWLKQIEDAQIAVFRTGTKQKRDLKKREGVWIGLQMAWAILTNGR